MKNLKLIEYVNKLTKREKELIDKDKEIDALEIKRENAQNQRKELEARKSEIKTEKENKELKKQEDELKKVEEELSLHKETSYDKVYLINFEKDMILRDKFNHLFKKLIDKIPAEKDNELKQVIMSALNLTEDGYQSKLKSISNVEQKNARGVAQGFWPLLVRDNFEKLIDGVEKLLSDKDIEDVVVAEEKYISKYDDQTPVYIFNNKIQDAKNSKYFQDLSEEKKIQVSKELDELNHTLIGSSSDYASGHDIFDKAYEYLRNKNNDKNLKDFMDKKVNDRGLKFGDVYTYPGLWEIKLKDDVTDNQEKIDVVNSFEVKLNDDAKNKIETIFNKFEKLDLVKPGDGGEAPTKIYGFAKLMDILSDIDVALSKGEFEKLKTLKNNYIKRTNDIREMFKTIKEVVAPNPERMPGNVDNIRYENVPAEFKADVPLNATYNGIYNLYSILKGKGISTKDFLSDPNKYVKQVILDETRKYQIGFANSDKSYEEQVALAYGDREYKRTNNIGISRMIGTLNLFVSNKEDAINNEAFIAIVVGKINAIEADDSMLTTNYFKEDRAGTLLNTLLVNPEDRDFEKLRSYKTKTSDKLHTIEPFDRIKYMNEKNILPNDFADRVSNFINSAYEISITDENDEDIVESRFSMGLFPYAIKDVQLAIKQYLMLKNPMENDGVDRLLNILKDPIKAFENLDMNEGYKRLIRGLKGKQSDYLNSKKAAKKAGERIIKNTRTAEKTYNSNAKRILDSANLISEKIKNEADEKKIENLQIELTKKMNDLKLLQKAEVERLKNEFKNGKLPENYYKQRVENIITLKHDEKIEFFDDGFDEEKYIKETGLEGLTKEEKEGLCLSEFERRKAQKEVFFNTLQLAKEGLLTNTVEDVEVMTANFETIDTNKLKDEITRTENLPKIEREQIVIQEAAVNNLDRSNDSVDLDKSVISEKSKELDDDSIIITTSKK